MKKLHTFVNRHFYHPDSIEFSRIWGLYERETITDPEELTSCDRAMSIIRRGLEVTHDADDDFLIGVMKNGAAPRYVYPTVDVILAYAPLLREIKVHPLGMTSCLDECVLIASLALALGCCRMEEIVFVGSPLHYTLYLFPDEEGYMFNAKREFFSREDWVGLSGGRADVSARMFIDKLYVCDRIITPDGYCIFPGGAVTVTPERMEKTVKRLAGFLAASPPELSRALETARDARAGGMLGAECIDGVSPPAPERIEAAIVRRVSARDVPLLEAALYAFRHPGVEMPELYREAAMNGFRSFILSGGVSSREDAREIAAGMAGTESIYGRTSRLAMPDEVLAFNTANDAERELLTEILCKLGK